MGGDQIANDNIGYTVGGEASIPGGKPLLFSPSL